MAEYAEVIKERDRMCKTIRCCDGCPIKKVKPELLLCGRWMEQNPKTTDYLVMKWASENPESDLEFDELKKLLRDDKTTIHQLVKWVVEGYKRTEEER